ncbi:MAG: prephenate dehydratase [Acidobacteriaceae bacterium]
MKVAIQGELGSFSHEAALKMLKVQGIRLELVPCALSAEVFERLEAGEKYADGDAVEAAVIPIENSLAGPVVEHYDLLLKHAVTIEREWLLRIRHNLIGVHGTRIEHLERVFSHPVALAQCRKFIASHPHILAVPFYDTAGSVKQVMDTKDRHLAGIASEEAAVQYGGEILAAGIEDNPENYTRFLLVKRQQEAIVDPQSNKMSVAFAVEHRPGTLVAALQLLADAGVDLTKIESRPVPGKPWEYVFYVDLRYDSPEIADRALAVLRNHCPMVKELGRYPSAGPKA